MAGEGMTAAQLAALGLTAYNPYISAGIMAGSSLAGNLMQAEAQRRQQDREIRAKAMANTAELQGEAAKSMGQGQQNAFAQLMNHYASILR